MDPLTILTAVTAAIKVAQMAIDAEQSAEPIIKSLYNRIANKPVADVTQADLDAIAAVSDQMTTEIMRPLDAD